MLGPFWPFSNTACLSLRLNPLPNHRSIASIPDFGFSSECKVTCLVCLCVDFIAGNPWEHPSYPSFYSQLLRVESSQLRQHAFGCSLISDGEKDRLQAAERGGTAAHNEQFLDFIRVGGRRSFSKLIQVLRQMGEKYSELSEDLSKLSPGELRQI